MFCKRVFSVYIKNIITYMFTLQIVNLLLPQCRQPLPAKSYLLILLPHLQLVSNYIPLKSIFRVH